ncbi:hypothetical protein [Nocardioides aurantiacus]|uniref:Uncharacterized protein n=1 Tax=Nocardioides aurantiacus TaxID=86796 RepID=A0A3N2CS69_9ACTN|nr:hypothetical protein [Nocardioides aurantiacus]ROR90382.1 hypothetical protein EDD33_1222 [Nocardioides aurantiacus]
MSVTRHRWLVPSAGGSAVVCGAVLLGVSSWAGGRSEQVGGMEATGYGYAALFAGLAGLPTLLLGGLALLLLRRPRAAGNLSLLAGLLVLFGGGAGMGTLHVVLGWATVAVGVAVMTLGVAATTFAATPGARGTR